MLSQRQSEIRDSCLVDFANKFSAKELSLSDLLLEVYKRGYTDGSLNLAARLRDGVNKHLGPDKSVELVFCGITNSGKKISLKPE